MKEMMIWCYSFKYKTSGGPWSQQKEELDPSNLYSMSRLKFKILLYNPFTHFYWYSSWRKWWFHAILSNTRHLEDLEVKRRKIWSPKIYIACHVWNSKSFSIILFPVSNHIHHEGNDDIMLFFEIQYIWRTLKSKEGRFGALKSYSMSHFKFKILL